MPSIRTLSQLPSISSTQIEPTDYFEVSVPVQISALDGKVFTKYATRKLSKADLTEKMLEDVRQNLIDENGLVEGLDVHSLCSTLSSVISDNMEFHGEKNFLENPLIDNSPLSDYTNQSDALNRYSVNYETLKKYANVNVSPTLPPGFGFITRLSNETAAERMVNLFTINKEGNVNAAAPVPSYVFDTNVKSMSEEEFVFKIPEQEKESNEWEAPASGIFTCFGWIDEMNNQAQSNATRWVALMAWEAVLQRWTILQVQPFVRNNYLSYVGFTFPVRKGLRLKIRTGFAVGSNSGKYFASSNSLANHMANSFLGGIYTGLSADAGDGYNYDYDNISGQLVPLSTLEEISSSIISHEISCDLSVNEKIDRISSTAVSRDDLDTLINNIGSTYAKKFYPSKYTGAKRITIRVGNSLSANYGGKIRGVFGAFNSGVTQICFGNSGWLEALPCLSVDWSSFDGTMRTANYYAPPNKTEIRDGKVGIIQRAYYPDDLPSGRVASDGKYFYYKTKYDGQVLIDLPEDWVSGLPAEATVCWVLCNTESRNFNRVIAVPLIGKHDCGVGSKSPGTISIYLAKDSILMFGIYLRQNISLATTTLVNALQPTTGNLLELHALSSMVSINGGSNDNPAVSGYYFASDYLPTAAGVAGSGRVVRYTKRLDVGESSEHFGTNSTPTLNYFFNEDTLTDTKYNLKTVRFHTVATIYELGRD